MTCRIQDNRKPVRVRGVPDSEHCSPRGRGNGRFSGCLCIGWVWPVFVCVWIFFMECEFSYINYIVDIFGNFFYEYDVMDFHYWSFLI